MWEIVLEPTMADPTVWSRAEMRPYGYEYYEILPFMLIII